jgi:Flp pilus assembly protein CpaB
VVDVLVTFDASSVPADAEPTVAVVEGAVVLAFGTRGDRDVPVTLLVPADAAARLAYAATAGTLTLVLDPPESAATT